MPRFFSFRSALGAALPAFLLLATGALTACGGSESNAGGGATAASGSSEAPADTVQVTLSSYAFEAARDTFVAGRPYRFVLENEADIAHEWAVVPRGDTTEANVLTEVEKDELPAGGSHAVTFAFPEAGAYDFACYMTEPVSHYDAGMVAPVTVVASR
ncbi:MAG: hypothetical protein BRD37_00160 [Bacteroidetes bacterium QH_8_67_23]|nr:MAG: hypothetical protein BRD37_00160 [Bacteroidetes bacterium QH_8_67_23]